MWSDIWNVSYIVLIKSFIIYYFIMLGPWLSSSSLSLPVPEDSIQRQCHHLRNRTDHSHRFLIYKVSLQLYITSHFALLCFRVFIVASLISIICCPFLYLLDPFVFLLVSKLCSCIIHQIMNNIVFLLLARSVNVNINNLWGRGGGFEN